MKSIINRLFQYQPLLGKRKADPMACKISGKIEATTFFVVAFDMQKAKKSPARGGAR